MPGLVKIARHSSPSRAKGKEHKIGLGGTPKIVNPPGADPIHHEYTQGKTTQLTFNDAGQNWKTKDSNYMLGTFTVDSVQYEKYLAGLSQKMAEMQKQKTAEKKE